MVCLLLPTEVSAYSSNPFTPAPDHQSEHKMILMSKASKVFAYYSPTQQSQTHVQLLYQLSVKNFSLVQLVRDNELVTIKTKPFDLQRLIKGGSMKVVADVYIGDYQKGGEKIYSDMALRFGRQLYVRILDELVPSNSTQEYDVVAYNRSNDRIFIHKLQKAPSYDHVIHIKIDSGCLSTFDTSTAVPERVELQYKFMNCGSMKGMYFETEAFSE